MKNFFLLFLISGCSIAVKTPSSRFISPEAKGKFTNGDVAISYSGYSKGVLSPTGVAPAPITDALAMEHNQSLATAGTIGFSEKVDVYVIAPEKSAPHIGIKFQVLGKSELDATKGNHSLAVTAALGQNNTTDVEVDLISGDDKADITNRVRDFSVIYGYRLEDNLLLYTGVSFSNYDFDGEFTEGTNVNRTFQYDSDTLGAHLGFMTSNQKWFVKIEGSIQESDWSYSDKQAYGFGAVQIGFKWH